MRIAFLGDIALIGKYNINNTSFENIQMRLSEIKKILERCDYVVANLETPLTNKIKTKEAKNLPLSSPIRNVEVLKYLGINFVSLSNNHIFDYGQDGVKECLETLKEANIDYFGIDNKSCLLEKDSQLVEISGYCCYTSNPWHYKENNGHILNALSIHKCSEFIDNCIIKKAYPIMSFHWGDENTHYPKKEHIEISDYIHNKYKTTIIGHHPHVIQGIKRYINGNTYFSLGNLCFDDFKSPTKSGVSITQINDNLEGYFIILDINGNNIENELIIPYKDNGVKLEIINNLTDKINLYSDEIMGKQDWVKYEEKRITEQKNAGLARLGKKDYKWIVGHLNITAFKVVYQRRINRLQFEREMEIVHEKNLFKDYYDFDENKKIIIYVGNFDYPNKSAAGKRVYNNSKILVKLGYTVILLGKSKYDFDGLCQLDKNIFFCSFPQYAIYKVNAYLSWMNKLIERNGIKPSLMIRYGSPSFAYFDKLIINWCKKRNIPLIVDVVDWLSADSKNKVFNIIKTIDTFLEKAIWNKKSDGIIAISKQLEKYYQKVNSPIVVIPPLVDEYKKNTSRNDVIKFVYAGSPFRVDSKVTNVHLLKDRLDLVVLAISELSKKYEIQFDIYGISKVEYLVAFPCHKVIIDECSIIYFHGIKSMEEVQKAINNSDYTVLIREKNRASMFGFPTKVVESISLGTPVITTNTSDLNSYIINGYNGYIVDIKNISKNLQDICLLNDSKINVMKEHCFNDKKFKTDNFEEIMNEFILNILKIKSHD